MALFWCIGKGYVEGGLLLLRSRERGVLVQGSLCSPLKSGGFLALLCAPVRGMLKGELLSLRSRERMVLIQGLLCSPLKSGGYVRGM